MAPTVEGDFEALDALRPILEPVLQGEMAGQFLPWMEANHQAWHAGEKETSLEIYGAPFDQKTRKYQAVTLDELRRKFATVAGNKELSGLLGETECLPFLEAGAESGG